MASTTPLLNLGKALRQVSFAVRDLDAARKFFSEKLGISEFRVVENFGSRVADATVNGHPAEFDFRLAIAWAGDFQIELIQPLSGETPYQDFIARRGQGIHHLAFFIEDRDEYERAVKDLIDSGFRSLMSGRVGDGAFTYIDTEPAIGAAIELLYLSPETRASMRPAG